MFIYNRKYQNNIMVEIKNVGMKKRLHCFWICNTSVIIINYHHCEQSIYTTIKTIKYYYCRRNIRANKYIFVL